MGKVANIIIEGEILPEAYIWPEYTATSLYRVRQQVAAAGEFDEINLSILFCPGGYCFEGWNMVDYLISLGKPIKTLAMGQCASFGTVLHSLGDEREITPFCEYVVHRPWGGFIGNDLQGEEYITMLKKETAKMFSVYSQSTGQTLDYLSNLIQKEDLILLPSETVEHGFSTSIYQPTLANLSQPLLKANLSKPVFRLTLDGMNKYKDEPKELKQTPENTMSAKKTSMLSRIAKTLKALADGTDLKALDNSLADGRILVTDSAGDAPAEGDTATIDGQPAPDGDYELTDGTIITVAGGVVTNITDPSGDSQQASTSTDGNGATDAETIAALRKENQEVKAKNEALETRMSEIERRLTSVLGQEHSKDAVIQANRQRTNGKVEPITDREQMLADHVAKYAKKQPAQ